MAFFNLLQRSILCEYSGPITQTLRLTILQEGRPLPGFSRTTSHRTNNDRFAIAIPRSGRSRPLLLRPFSIDARSLRPRAYSLLHDLQPRGKNMTSNTGKPDSERKKDK